MLPPLPFLGVAGGEVREWPGEKSVQVRNQNKKHMITPFSV